jgi:osmotically inducible protein OsmC
MGQQGGGWKITRIHLDTQAAGPGLDSDTFTKAANQAKEQCPVSVLLRPGLESITLDARLQ